MATNVILTWWSRQYTATIEEKETQRLREKEPQNKSTREPIQVLFPSPKPWAWHGNARATVHYTVAPHPSPPLREVSVASEYAFTGKPADMDAARHVVRNDVRTGLGGR